MPNPTPIYRVQFDGNYLPGYVQSMSQPLRMRGVANSMLGRDGASQVNTGAGLRRISMSIRILSRLGTATGLQHLADCNAQYAEALRYLTRVNGEKYLKIGNMGKKVLARFVDSNVDLNATENNRITYTVDFDAQPYYVSDVAQSTTFSGNGTASLTMTDTRETYPIFSVPSTVTSFTATHSSGKVVQFVRGAFGDTIVIDCGKLTVISTSNGQNSSATMANVNFGISHTSGAGTFSVTISNYGGSGSVTMSMFHRYELND